jgi:phosphoenolpyruvate carboxylase
VRGYLDEMHNKRMSPYEKIELLEAIRAQVQAAWRTDEIRRQKPTPQVKPSAKTPCVDNGFLRFCGCMQEAQVQAAWRTDEIRRQKPTPQVGHN